MSTQSTLEDSVPESSEIIQVGDHVTDRQNQKRKMVVTGVPPYITAKEYKFDGSTTVAEANPDYPADDQVIEVKFIEKDNDYLPENKYAYPTGRLKVINSIHDS
jgi:hypothetical protein